MGTYQQADDEISVRQQHGSRVHQTIGSPNRPRSVAGDLLSMENHTGSRLVSGSMDLTGSRGISPRALGDPEGHVIGC